MHMPMVLNDSLSMQVRPKKKNPQTYRQDTIRAKKSRGINAHPISIP